MGFFGAAHGWGGGKKAKKAPSLKSVTDILQWWNLAKLYLPEEDPKNVWLKWHNPSVLLTSTFFHQKSANFAISRNTDIDCILIYNFQFLFLESLKIILIKMVKNLRMSAKMAALGILNIKLFWNNGYDVIISVHNLTNKILLRDWNYIVSVVLWPKVDNSSISMRKVIIISVL